MKPPVLCASLLLFAVSANAAVTYTLTDLGTLPGGFQVSQSAGINNLGQVVGYSTTADAKIGHAFLYSEGVMHDLGTLGGVNSYASSINDNGQVVGWSEQSDAKLYPFLYSNGAMSSLGFLGRALSINNSGTIVGTATTGFVYSNGTVSYFATYGGNSSGVGGINDNGVIVGNARKINDTFHAFRYSGGDTEESANMTDLNSLVSPSSGFVMDSANAVNSSGQIVGQGYKTNKGRAFLFSNGTIIDLGALIAPDGYSAAYAINESGQIVGEYSTASTQGAFIYSNGVASDFNNLLSGAAGWSVGGARAINDLGQIAASATSPQGNYHAVLLTPHGSPDPVPVQPAAPIAKVSGKKKVTVSSASFPVKGTAAGTVTKVTYRVGNKGAYKKAKGTNQWSFKAKLSPGKNKISVIVEGPGGKSKAVSITVTRED